MKCRLLHKIAAVGTLLTALTATGFLSTSCREMVPQSRVNRVDSLNSAAYAWRYRDPMRCSQLSAEALRESDLYAAGKAEAWNNLGLAAFMRMEYAEADRCFTMAQESTNNQTELLVADVGWMKLCQRTARNKEFYDYRNSALQRLQRIDEEEQTPLTAHERSRLRFARSEFFLTSATYYYYLQQQEDALRSMEQLRADRQLPADTGQWLYAAYLEGAASLLEPSDEHDRRLRCFDLLYSTFREAQLSHLIYIEGNALQGMANLMTSPTAFRFFINHRLHELTQCSQLLMQPDQEEVDSLFPLRLAREALSLFQQYGDPYQVANGYVTICRYLNDHSRYAEALDSLQRAMESLNGGEIPECQLRIDEQLSVSHAGLDNKGESDRYRNRYLDIMERTRQDRELENRLETLERESAQLNLSLMLLVAVILLSLLLFILFRRHRRTRQIHMLLRLRRLIELCRTIIGAIPPTASTPEEVEEALLQAIALPLRPLFGEKTASLREKQLHFDAPLTAEEQAMLKLINPYVAWAIDNGQATLLLEEQRITLEEQRAMHELHIATGKRQNVAKRACLSVVNGIFPFIDRILHEVERLKSETTATQQRQRLHYIDELSTTINEYNDILAYWIKMRQGTLSLHIERFTLSELFTLISKSSRSFAQKQQQLIVCPTALTVKADKALTLFMLNTLTENARKYTPQGGIIRVEAHEVVGEGCVEISVTDNGPGLSPTDVQFINEKKIYDPTLIGSSGSPEQVEQIRQAKGSGFGLMNCKGIIEKYRKSSALFACCTFRVESTWGQGCRFLFRLPIGEPPARGHHGAKSAYSLLLLLLFTLSASPLQATPTQQKVLYPTDAEALLDTASTYADKAYYSNVDGHYAQTILYADSAIAYLNRHLELCRPQLPEPLQRLPQMQLTGSDEAAELTWWHTTYDSDFHIILDVRNEAAVAFLALKQWEAYRYNNFAYTSLYKLLGEDRSLAHYCQTLQRHTDHKSVALVGSILLLLILLSSYLLVAFRRRMMTQWNMEQVLDITHRLYTSTTPLPDAERLKELPLRMMSASFEPIRAILPIHGMALAYYNEQSDRLEVTPYGETAPLQPTLIQQCFDTAERIEEGPQLLLPLLLKQGDERRCIGVLYLLTERDSDRSTHLLLLQLITDYWSVVLYNALMKISGKYHDIESASDETRRASWEESKLHVQNLVLDNCLSTIKHETIYYPNKIKQLAAQLEQTAASHQPITQTQVEEIGELIAYYKGIFTLLSSCADRQVERMLFRRTAIRVEQLTTYATRFYHRATRSMNQPIRPFVVTWTTNMLRASDQEPELSDHELNQPNADIHPRNEVWGDEELLHDLLECLLLSLLALPSEASAQASGKALAESLPPITLCVSSDGDDFIRFTLCDPLHSYPDEELNSWFHPQLKQIQRQAHGKCEGTEYLVAKQIIRQHDELAGRRGCRINAHRLQPQGLALYFTLPRKRQQDKV